MKFGTVWSGRGGRARRCQSDHRCCRVGGL